jgi:hypothetical protein
MSLVRVIELTVPNKCMRVTDDGQVFLYTKNASRQRLNAFTKFRPQRGQKNGCNVW